MLNGKKKKKKVLSWDYRIFQSIRRTGCFVHLLAKQRTSLNFDTSDVYEEPRYCYAWKLIVMLAVIRITKASKVKISLFKTLQTSWLRQKHLKLTDILENTVLSTFNPCNRTHFSQRRLTLSLLENTHGDTSLILFVTTGFQEAIRGHTGTGSDPFQLSSR